MAGPFFDEIPDVALAIYAHPDDAEVAAGGTLALWAANGSAVNVCVCAQGDKGSLDPAVVPAELASLRKAESVRAGAVLGVRRRFWLDHPDGELEDGLELRGQLVSLIRDLRPDVVLAPDPTAVFFGQTYINHRDHRVTGWAAIDAVVPGAANPHYFPGAQPAHSVGTLLLSGTLEPDVWVDVTTSIDAKAQAVVCHASQIGDGGDLVMRSVRSRAADAGKRAGTRFAEGFRHVILA